jgi:two-component system, sensor histidine kinase PdtaS
MGKLGFFSLLGLLIAHLFVLGQTSPPLDKKPADTLAPPASSLTIQQQCLLLQLAGSFYNVTKYATVDIDSGMILATRSLGLSLLPVMTDGDAENFPSSLGDWVAKERPEDAKSKLPTLHGIRHLQELFLLGAWYAYQPNVHKDLMDSAIFYLTKAKAESMQLHQDRWSREANCLLGKAYNEKGDTLSGNMSLRKTIGDCLQAGDRITEARAWYTWGIYFVYSPATGAERVTRLEKALQLYTLQNDLPHRVNTLMDIGYLSFSVMRLAQAKTAFYDALRLEDSTGWRYTHYSTDLLAFTAHNEGQYSDMLRNALRSVKSSAVTSDSLCWGTFYMRMASVYDASSLFMEDRFQWNYKAVRRFLRSGGDILLYLYMIPVVEALVQKKQVKEANDLIEMAHQQYPPANPIDLLYYYIALSAYYDGIHDLASFEKYALIAFDQEKLVAANAPFVQGTTYRALAKVYYEEGKFKAAEQLLRAYLTTNDPIQIPQARLDALTTLIKIDSIFGNQAAAAQDYSVFVALDTKVFDAVQSRQVELLKVQYETSEKEKDIELLHSQDRLKDAQLKQAAFVRKVSFGGILLLLAVAGLFFNRYRLKKRSNLQLQQQKEEIDNKNVLLESLVVEKDGLLDTKEWLLRELHHRVKNNLQVMMSLQELQARNLTTEEALTAVTDSSNRLYALSLIHQKLYRPDGSGEIDLGQYIAELLRHLGDAFAPERPVRLDIDLSPGIELDVAQAIPLGLILNEAVTNAFKYAFIGVSAEDSGPAAKSPHIQVNLSWKGSDRIQLIVKDNGRGYYPAPNESKRRSMGFSLMEALAEQLDGEFSVVNAGGLAIIMTFIKKAPSGHEIPTRYQDMTTTLTEA